MLRQWIISCNVILLLGFLGLYLHTLMSAKAFTILFLAAWAGFSVFCFFFSKKP